MMKKNCFITNQKQNQIYVFLSRAQNSVELFLFFNGSGGRWVGIKKVLNIGT